MIAGAELGRLPLQGRSGWRAEEWRQKRQGARRFIVGGDSAYWHIRPGCEGGAQFSSPNGSGCLWSKSCVRPLKQLCAQKKSWNSKFRCGGTQRSYSVFLKVTPPNPPNLLKRHALLIITLWAVWALFTSDRTGCLLEYEPILCVYVCSEDLANVHESS